MRMKLVLLVLAMTVFVLVAVGQEVCGYYGMPACTPDWRYPDGCYEGENRGGMCIHCGFFGEPACIQREPGCIHIQYKYEITDGFCVQIVDKVDRGQMGTAPYIVDGESVCYTGVINDHRTVCLHCGHYEQPCCVDGSKPCQYGECTVPTYPHKGGVCKRNLTEDTELYKYIHDLEFHPSPFVRKRAAQNLEAFKGRFVDQITWENDERVIRAFIKALKGDNDWEVRAAAAQGLAFNADDRSVDPLIQALEDEHWFVRKTAAEGLGSIGAGSLVDPKITAEAIEPLTRALTTDDDNMVRTAAKEALEKIRAAEERRQKAEVWDR